MESIDGLREAISVAGSVPKLAQKIGIKRQAVWMWQKPGRKVPPDRAIEIERITGVNRSKLRPDLWPNPEDLAAFEQKIRAAE